MTVLEDMVPYLVSKGIGTYGTDLFTGIMPDQPDNVTTLREYGGAELPLTWNGEEPRMNVLVRNLDYDAGRHVIGEIVKSLHGVHETVINGTRYLLIKALQTPTLMGRDTMGRTTWSVNFEFIKEREV